MKSFIRILTFIFYKDSFKYLKINIFLASGIGQLREEEGTGYQAFLHHFITLV
jgi:hypothetical protein